MKLKAKVCFAGKLSMVKNQITECNDIALCTDLLKAGFVVEVKDEKPEKETKKVNRKTSTVKKTGDVNEN